MIPEDRAAQHARFIETARALGCDESEAAFDEKLKVIARRKTQAMPHNDKSPDQDQDRG